MLVRAAVCFMVHKLVVYLVFSSTGGDLTVFCGVVVRVLPSPHGLREHRTQGSHMYVHKYLRTNAGCLLRHAFHISIRSVCHGYCIATHTRLTAH